MRALYAQEIMRPELKSQLDNELRSQWLVKVFLIFIVFPACCFLMYLAIDPNSIKSSTVVGVAVNRSVSYHDEGHTNYLHIEVPNENRIIKVSLPSATPIKTGVKVAVRKLEKPSSKKARYMFLKYIE